MSLTTIIWPVCAGLSLAVAVIYLLVWLKSPKQLENLAFSLSAFSATALTLLELFLMHAQTPAEYGQLLRWMHVPAGVIVVSIVWFVHLFVESLLEMAGDVNFRRLRRGRFATAPFIFFGEFQ